MNALFYISGHGLGHATRQIALMQALRAEHPDARIHVRTCVPRSILGCEVPGELALSRAQIDTGVAERDLFHQDGLATLQQYARLHAHRDTILAEEVNYVRTHGIDGIVCDIPPLAAAIGRRSGIPVVAVSNFGWDSIYAPYVEEHPEYAWLLDALQEDYRLTTLLLRLPFHEEMAAFPRKRDIPLLVRAPQDGCGALRELGLDPERARPIVLIGGRMFDFEALRASDLLASGAYTVLVLGDPGIDLGKDVRVLGPEWGARFLELIGLSDLMIAKLGYGIVSDCIASGTALVYPPRFGFPEYEILEREMPGMLSAQRIELGAFQRGEWKEAADRALAGRHGVKPPALDGARVAVAALREIAGSSS